MKQIQKGITLLLLLSSASTLLAQQAIDFQAMRSVIQVESSAPAYASLAKNNSHELTWAVSQMFLFYKTYISSQDGNRCSFHPSCSEYSIQVIKKRGFLLGGLTTFDRLIRCNGLSPELYQVDTKRRLLIDYPQ